MKTRTVVEFDGKTYDPTTLTVRELQDAGIDPLVGVAPAVLLGLMLKRDYSDDEIIAILDREQEVSEMEVRLTVSSRPG